MRRRHRMTAGSCLVLLVTLVLVAACGDDDPFCPEYTIGRQDLGGHISVDTQGGVTALRGISHIEGHLTLSGEDITDLRPLRQLRSINGTLTLRNLTGIDSVQDLAGLRWARRLRMSSCPGIMTLAPFSGVDSCTSVQVEQCESLETLPASDLFARVERGTLADLPRLESLAAISGAGSMNNLRLSGLPAGLEFDVISDFNLMRYLSLGDISLEELPDLSAMSELWSLTLEDMPVLRSSAGRPTIPARSMSLRNCGSLADLDLIAGADSLETLYAVELAGLVSLSGVERLPVLRSITVADCPLLTELGALSDLSGLESLAIEELPLIRGVPELSDHPGLREAEFRSCTGLADLHDLPIAPGGSLRVVSCEELSSLQGMALPDSMQSLYFYELRLPDLSGLDSLRTVGWLTLSTSDVRSLDGLDQLRTIRGGITIQDNPLLADADVLAGVDTVGYSVRFEDNFGLDTCRIEKLVAAWGDVIVYIGDNGPCAPD